jgi:hypothetical protein
MQIPHAPERHRTRGTLVVSADRPQNPPPGTTWIDPNSGKTYRWNGSSWTEAEAAGGGSLTPVTSGGTGASTAAGARTNLGIGTLGTQEAADANLTGRIRLGKVRTVSANHTCDTSDTNILGTSGAGGITVTLPAANLAGQIIRIVKVDAGVGALTVSRAGSDTINGATSISLASQYDKCELISDGNGSWLRIT